MEDIPKPERSKEELQPVTQQTLKDILGVCSNLPGTMQTSDGEYEFYYVPTTGLLQFVPRERGPEGETVLIRYFLKKLEDKVTIEKETAVDVPEFGDTEDWDAVQRMIDNMDENDKAKELDTKLG